LKNGKKLLEALQFENPDVIVTDLEMPVADGTFVIKQLRNTEKFKNIPIIVFSSLASEENERKYWEWEPMFLLVSLI